AGGGTGKKNQKGGPLWRHRLWTLRARHQANGRGDANPSRRYGSRHAVTVPNQIANALFGRGSHKSVTKCRRLHPAQHSHRQESANRHGRTGTNTEYPIKKMVAVKSVCAINLRNDFV